VKNPINNTLGDLDGRERGAVWPLAVLALIMGVASPLWIRPMDAAVAAIISGEPAKPSPHALSSRVQQTPAISASSSRGEQPPAAALILSSQASASSRSERARVEGSRVSNDLRTGASGE
jgi:hypothetical protein